MISENRLAQALAHQPRESPRESFNSRIKSINTGRVPKFLFVPPLDRADGEPTHMRAFHGTGVAFLAKAPKASDRALSYYLGAKALILIEDFVSEHLWHKAEPGKGFEQTNSVVWRVRARRFYKTGDELIVDRKLRQHPAGTGHNPGYVRRINKKWAKNNVMDAVPRSQPFFLMIGRSTCQRVQKSMIDAIELFGEDNATVILDRLEATSPPFQFGRSMSVSPLYNRF